jgi:hypothetical protein
VALVGNILSTFVQNVASNWSKRDRTERAARLQALAFAAAATRLAADLAAPAEFKLLNRAAIREFRKTWLPLYDHPRRDGQWEWENEILPRFAKDPDAFRLAIWSDSQLCGLALGTVTNNLKGVIVNFIAGSPDPNHPLRGSILSAAIAAAEEYARGLGASRLYLADPATGLLASFKSLGFKVAKGRDGTAYCVREV